MKKIERQLMFGLSNAQAAATLAAVLVGYNIVLPDGSRLLNDDVSTADRRPSLHASSVR